MDEKYHTGLVNLQAAELPDRTRFCPDDQIIAEYFDNGLEGRDRDSLERHLDQCRFCRARVGIIERLEHHPQGRRIPGSVLAQAKQSVEPIPRRRFRTVPVGAAAAMVLISLATVVGNLSFSPKSAETSPSQVLGQEPSRQLRSINPVANPLHVRLSTSGSDIGYDAVFRWDDMPGRLHYDIAVLSEDGDVLLALRLQDNQWALDPSLPLEYGAKYFFRVEARLADGRAVRSRHHEFRIGVQE